MELQAAEGRVAMWNSSGGSGSDESLRQVVLELGIHRNEERAAEHEEFIATINKQVQSSFMSNWHSLLRGQQGTSTVSLTTR
jgi:hypothetical protein